MQEPLFFGGHRRCAGASLVLCRLETGKLSSPDRFSAMRIVLSAEALVFPVLPARSMAFEWQGCGQLSALRSAEVQARKVHIRHVSWRTFLASLPGFIRGWCRFRDGVVRAGARPEICSSPPTGKISAGGDGRSSFGSGLMAIDSGRAIGQKRFHDRTTPAASAGA